MLRRLLMSGFLAVAALIVSGDGWVYAARCTPLAQGVCHACKNCRYCSHCAKHGGKCTVCQ
jgi:hypothetical protein